MYQICTKNPLLLTYLSIDASIVREKDAHFAELYSVQLQLQNETDCVIIKEPINNVGGERVPLGSVFNAIAKNYHSANGLVFKDNRDDRQYNTRGTI